jgi:hypothetical protein
VTVGPIIYVRQLGHDRGTIRHYGVNARIFRQARRHHTEYPEKKMCLNPAAVELAMKCHEDTCCVSKS